MIGEAHANVISPPIRARNDERVRPNKRRTANAYAAR